LLKPIVSCKLIGISSGFNGSGSCTILLSQKALTLGHSVFNFAQNYNRKAEDKNSNEGPAPINTAFIEVSISYVLAAFIWL
jgi:hypothetical protein